MKRDMLISNLIEDKTVLLICLNGILTNAIVSGDDETLKLISATLAKLKNPTIKPESGSRSFVYGI